MRCKVPVPCPDIPAWLSRWMASKDISLWGAADLHGLSTVRDEAGRLFPFGISVALPMPAAVMAAIRTGPNQAYADAYSSVNQRIDTLLADLAEEIRNRGFSARALAASERTDTKGIRGDFPHKTAATRAGLGWIGRHCQLITRPFGPWVRLGTVFTGMPLPCGPPAERSHCGTCMRCVEACPAKALKGAAWRPGLPRSAMLDAWACDEWKKAHYYQYHKGHNCGICSAVCPYALKRRRR